MAYITELLCALNGFYTEFNESLQKALIPDQKTKVKKSPISLFEVITIII